MVYACVDLLVAEQEYAGFFASTAARPLAPPVRPCLGANGTVPSPPSQCPPDPAADSELALPFSVSGSDRTGTCPAKQDRLLPLRDSTAAALLVAWWWWCAIPSRCCEGTRQPCSVERRSLQGPAWAIQCYGYSEVLRPEVLRPEGLRYYSLASALWFQVQITSGACRRILGVRQ